MSETIFGRDDYVVHSKTNQTGMVVGFAGTGARPTVLVSWDDGSSSSVNPSLLSLCFEREDVNDYLEEMDDEEIESYNDGEGEGDDDEPSNEAAVDAAPSDTRVIDCGYFMLSSPAVLSNVLGIDSKIYKFEDSELEWRFGLESTSDVNSRRYEANTQIKWDSLTQNLQVDFVNELLNHFLLMFPMNIMDQIVAATNAKLQTSSSYDFVVDSYDILMYFGL
jgi:hypothetical protein